MTHWVEIAASKVTARDALIPQAWKITETEQLNVLDIPRTCGLLDSSQTDITETSATVLVDRLRKGELKSRDVMESFCKRAAIAQQLVCLFINFLYRMMYQLYN